MNDFLSRLVERAGSAPAIVRPVLPSRYEPVTAVSAFAATSTASGTELISETEHKLEMKDEAGAEMRSVQNRVASDQSVRPERASSATPGRLEATVELTSADSVRIPSAEPELRKSAAETRAIGEPPTESPVEPTVVWPPTAQPVELTELQPPAEDAKAVPPPLISAGPASASPRRVQPVATATRAGQLLIPAGAPTPLPPIASRNRARTETSFATDADSSPAPTIHVTIGRVEVRAIMPAAQATQPPARPAPKMSLDDYLRRRNEGAA
jgi:hypothetical protein